MSGASPRAARESFGRSVAGTSPVEVPAKFGVSETKVGSWQSGKTETGACHSKATQEAFERAGMKVMRILEEPVGTCTGASSARREKSAHASDRRGELKVPSSPTQHGTTIGARGHIASNRSYRLQQCSLCRCVVETKLNVHE